MSLATRVLRFGRGTDGAAELAPTLGPASQPALPVSAAQAAGSSAAQAAEDVLGAEEAALAASAASCHPWMSSSCYKTDRYCSHSVQTGPSELEILQFLFHRTRGRLAIPHRR